jgi:CMP-N,N'-diacetyllegionaminic acid synthase
MALNRETLAVIPARGGSKRVPWKNIQPVGGRPLIAWTIEAARSAPGITRIVVSTDSVEIADVARHYGAEVPMLRSSSLARDETPGIEPVVHAVEWLDEHERYRPDCVALLQPTSPLRTAADVEAALALMWTRNSDAVVSVCPASHPCSWLKRVGDDGRLLDLDGDAARRPADDDGPPVYVLNGSLYVVRYETLMARRSFYDERTYAYVMPIERSLDVDSPWDLHVADLLLTDRVRQWA